MNQKMILFGMLMTAIIHFPSDTVQIKNSTTCIGRTEKSYWEYYGQGRTISRVFEHDQCAGEEIEFHVEHNHGFNYSGVIDKEKSKKEAKPFVPLFGEKIKDELYLIQYYKGEGYGIIVTDKQIFVSKLKTHLGKYTGTLSFETDCPSNPFYKKQAHFYQNGILFKHQNKRLMLFQIFLKDYEGLHISGEELEKYSQYCNRGENNDNTIRTINS
jgi:hypothetical protein